ncbi:MAG: sulfatase [Bacteroidales bacterium]|nr:sulfatase [Bacteroidales bacterium]
MKIYYTLIAFLLFTSCNNKIAKENELPNIIIIYTDDLGYGDIGCYGATDISTPNIDQMATDGIRFTEFYTAAPVCSPSRAGLLTGRLPVRMGINAVFFPESFTGMPPGETTIAELLKGKGYSTGIVGKWHLGHRNEFLPLQQGFDSYFGIPYSNDMTSVVYMRDNHVESFHIDQTQLTKTYTKEAIEFINKHKENPFFLYVAHNMPHVPIYASDKFLGTSKRGLYGDVVQEIDWSVGEIIKTLEKNNILENTLVIFTSDNGPWLAMKDHGGSAGILREGKQYTFEGGMRVPGVAMWKGKIPAGKVYEDLASQMDLFPTIARLTGIDIPQDTQYDGVDISNVLLEDGKRTSDYIMYYNEGNLKCYRKGAWKIKMPFEGFAGAPWKKAVAAHDTLLFNLKKDPGEKENLFKQYPDTAGMLLKEMIDMERSMGEFAPSLIVNSPADNSHYEYLKSLNN